MSEIKETYKRLTDASSETMERVAQNEGFLRFQFLNTRTGDWQNGYPLANTPRQLASREEPFVRAVFKV